MSLSDLASMGTLISSAAVLVSLVYLSIQVRLTEKNQLALINQGVLTRTTEMVRWNAEPHISEVVTRVLSGDEAFNAEEINRLRLILRVRLSNFQDAHAQRRRKLVDAITYEQAYLSVQMLMAQPVFRAMWRRHAPTYPSELSHTIEQLISETPLIPPADSVAQFKADVALVREGSSRSGA